MKKATVGMLAVALTGSATVSSAGWFNNSVESVTNSSEASSAKLSEAFNWSKDILVNSGQNIKGATVKAWKWSEGKMQVVITSSKGSSAAVSEDSQTMSDASSETNAYQSSVAILTKSGNWIQDYIVAPSKKGIMVAVDGSKNVWAVSKRESGEFSEAVKAEGGMYYYSKNRFLGSIDWSATKLKANKLYIVNVSGEIVDSSGQVLATVSAAGEGTVSFLSESAANKAGKLWEAIKTSDVVGILKISGQSAVELVANSAILAVTSVERVGASFVVSLGAIDESVGAAVDGDYQGAITGSIQIPVDVANAMFAPAEMWSYQN